ELKPAEDNLITVAINNTLSSDTVPQGSVVWQNNARFPAGYFTLNYNFDFFNYAGIHRSVFLYTTPKVFIDDIDVTTKIDGTTGHVTYAIRTVAEARNAPLEDTQGVDVTVELRDQTGKVVGTADGSSGEISVPNAKLWWPFTMVQNDRDAGYLYTLVVTSTDSESKERDVYRLKVGIRTVSWTEKQFLINN
ncbi:unnamed protein product, partial [Allacma fusca]